MDEINLEYHVIQSDDQEAVIMIDSLLGRIFSPEEYRIARKRGQKVYKICFWSTADEWEFIAKHLSKAVKSDWDSEYEVLCNQRRGLS